MVYGRWSMGGGLWACAVRGGLWAGGCRLPAVDCRLVDCAEGACGSADALEVALAKISRSSRMTRPGGLLPGVFSAYNPETSAPILFLLACAGGWNWNARRQEGSQRPPPPQHQIATTRRLMLRNTVSHSRPFFCTQSWHRGSGKSGSGGAPRQR